MKLSRNQILSSMKISERQMLDGHLWKQEYSEVPIEVKEDLKKRFMYAYINYRYAKHKVEYFSELLNKGLNPHSMLPTSGYVYLFNALQNDAVISAYLLVDKNPETHGLLGLRKTVRRYAANYSDLMIHDIEGDILNSPDIQKLVENRNSIVAHSNKDILQYLENNQFDMDSMDNCLNEVFNVIQTINDTYFDSSVSPEHNFAVDKNFIDDLIKIYESS